MRPTLTSSDQTPAEWIYDEPAERPRAAAVLKHFVLLAATFVTATLAGTLYPFGPVETLPTDEFASWGEVLNFIATMPVRYAMLIGSAFASLASDPAILFHALSFSISLLFILICHEMGHYLACRYYRVDATLPYFMPTPPLIGPAGTFGAFIKIRSPMPSRKAVFDIGLAGPIAGFAALLPVAVAAFMTMESGNVRSEPIPGTIIFADPLLFQALSAIFNVDLSSTAGNGFYFAAWVGLLVTALNLTPAGQLDGGHGIYALFGERANRISGLAALVVMSVTAAVGLIFYGTPSGLLLVVLIGLIVRAGHPEPLTAGPLGSMRKAVAVAVLLIWLLSFVPFPISIV